MLYNFQYSVQDLHFFIKYIPKYFLYCCKWNCFQNLISSVHKCNLFLYIDLVSYSPYLLILTAFNGFFKIVYMQISYVSFHLQTELVLLLIFQSGCLLSVFPWLTVLAELYGIILNRRSVQGSRSSSWS